MNYILKRTVKDKDGTCGVLINPANITLCATLERPDNGNKPDDPKTKTNDSGCIPAGTYSAKWTYSPKFKRFTFEILEVKGRSGVRIHSAIHIDHLLGCIGVGKAIHNTGYKDGVRTYKYWLQEGKKTLKEIESSLPKEFTLTIVDPA